MPPNPFSFRSEGPRTDAERASFRLARARENAAPADPQGFEHILTTKDVRDYLAKKFRDDPARANLCKYPLGCDVNDVEPILQKDLLDAKTTGSVVDPKNIHQLRQLIRAASWGSIVSKSPERHLALAHELVESVEARQRELERTDPDEAKEWNEIAHMANVVEDALTHHLAGDEAEIAAQAMEHFLSVAIKERRDRVTLTRLRELRDQIYFQRLYPIWFRAGV